MSFRFFCIFHSKMSEKTTSTSIRLLLSSGCDSILWCFRGTEVKKKCTTGLITIFHRRHRRKPMLSTFSWCLCTLNFYFSQKIKIQWCSLILKEYFFHAAKCSAQAIHWGVWHPSLCNDEKLYRGFHSSPPKLVLISLSSFYVPSCDPSQWWPKKQVYVQGIWIPCLASGLQILC